MTTKSVIRGGGWLSTAVGCRSAYRGRYSPSLRNSRFLGFRVVKEKKKKEKKIEYRVNRGGCWYEPAVICWSAYRGRNNPSLRNYYNGFRVIKESKDDN